LFSPDRVGKVSEFFGKIDRLLSVPISGDYSEFFHAEQSFPLLLSTRQRQSDMNQRNDATNHCSIVLQHSSDSPGTNDL